MQLYMYLQKRADLVQLLLSILNIAVIVLMRVIPLVLHVLSTDSVLLKMAVDQKN